ncbi:MAG: ABC transporter substrate-binding protein [Thaumarchaeota archaeon]|nr:ABC transporter substrate-binding protein [Nitrososphaerota archaeon]
MNQVITALAALVAIATILTAPAYAQTSGDSDADSMMMIPEGTIVYAGSLLPLTGVYSSVGVQVNAATVLAVEHFNEYLSAKDAGWELVLFQENTASNPVIALEKAQALHSRGADIIFGPAGSSRVKHISGYVNDNNMILLSCCSTSTEMAIADDRVFRVVADDANQGKAFGIILANDGIEVVVPYWRVDSYGDSLRNAAVSEFEARNGTYDEGVSYNPDVREFSVSIDALARIVQGYVDSHGADKVAIVVVAYDEIVSIMQAADSYPVLKEVRWYGSETLAQNPFIVKDRIANDFAIEAEFAAIQVPLGDGPRAQNVTDALSVPFGGTPNAFAYNAYDAVWLAGLSIERTGSTDPADIAATLPSVAANYTGGALSSTALNEFGDLAAAIYGTWHINATDGNWYVDSVISIDDESVVPFE